MTEISCASTWNFIVPAKANSPIQESDRDTAGMHMKMTKKNLANLVHPQRVL